MIHNVGLPGSIVGSIKKDHTNIVAGESYTQIGSVVNALDGDENAQQQLDNIATGLVDAVSNPSVTIDKIKAHHNETLAKADALRAAGKIDEAERLENQLYIEYASYAVGGAGAIKAGTGIVKGVGNTTRTIINNLDEAIARGWDGRLDNYTYNPADGTFTRNGTGGKLIPTGQKDPISGDYIFQRGNANGDVYGRLTINSNGNQVTTNVANPIKPTMENSSRPTPTQSEIDVGADLGGAARPQVSYFNGKEVPYGTAGSVRLDWCIGNSCSIEVKNYNIANNSSGLVNNITEQAIYRQNHLPNGMQQTVVIDIRGQNISTSQKNRIKESIVDKSNGIINLDDIEFME